jgi:CDP-glucose 4,6-dehydratase
MVNPSPNFWRDKRVLLTGHTGFKGGWLAAWLHRLGATVCGYSLAPPTTPSLSELAQLEQRMCSVRGDIRDAGHLASAVQAFQPDVVFHLAAQSLVRLSYNSPLETLEANVTGTVNVLEAIRAAASVRVGIIVTSDKCYENRGAPWSYREGEPLGGHDPYSASKACAEILTSAWRRSYLSAEVGRAVGIASARAGNVIGGGDWADARLVPDIVRALTAGKAVKIRNPNATRPWQHVLEPLCGYLLLAERLWEQPNQYSEAWNLGPDPGEVQPVAQVVARMTQAWGVGASWEVEADQQKLHEATDLAIDSSKARARLGWQPRLKLADAVDWTAEWYREQSRGADAFGLMERQIERYERL